jgi:hypothetical protein
VCCHTVRFAVSLVCWVKLSSMPFQRELAAALLVAAVGLPGAWLRPWLVRTQLRLACQTLRLGNSNLGRILPGSE